MTLLVLSAALAQDYAFPSSASDYNHWYPTAYVDHGGRTDWACGNDTYGGHSGSDYGAGSWAGMAAGRDVNAAASGRVTYVHDGERDDCQNNCSSGANVVQIQHNDGTATLYAHLKRWSITVDVGDWVDCNDKIGEMGSSGNSSAPHLHFAVYDNSYTDPFNGSCNTSPSQWVNQGSYGGRPALTCDSNQGSGGGCSALYASGSLAILFIPPLWGRRRRRS